jgi:DNA-binding ferritin-like protein (Dps family)
MGEAHCLSYNKIPDSVLSYLKSNYEEGNDYYINNYKGEKVLEFCDEFLLEKEETFERQRKRFAQTFLDRVEELLTLGKSLGENGGLK